MGEESLYKRIDQTLKGRRPENPDLLRELLKLAEKHQAPFPLMDEFEAAINGEQSAKERVTQRGDWEAFCLGMASRGEKLSPPYAHILAIEKACKKPHQLIYEGKFIEAAQFLVSDQLMSRFLWPDAVEIIKATPDFEKLLPLRASIAIETYLSAIAAWDAYSGLPNSQVVDILPDPQKPNCNPTKLFFDWLKDKIGAKSLSAIFNDKRLSALSIDMITLKRWSSGRHHPDSNSLRPLVTALFDEAEAQSIWARYAGSKYLNFIGYIAQEASQKAESLIGTGMEKDLSPWPELPFKYTSFASWCQDRYPYWYRYHKENMPN